MTSLASLSGPLSLAHAHSNLPPATYTCQLSAAQLTFAPLQSEELQISLHQQRVEQFVLPTGDLSLTLDLVALGLTALTSTNDPPNSFALSGQTHASPPGLATIESSSSLATLTRKKSSPGSLQQVEGSSSHRTSAKGDCSQSPTAVSGTRLKFADRLRAKRGKSISGVQAIYDPTPPPSSPVGRTGPRPTPLVLIAPSADERASWIGALTAALSSRPTNENKPSEQLLAVKPSNSLPQALSARASGSFPRFFGAARDTRRSSSVILPPHIANAVASAVNGVQLPDGFDPERRRPSWLDRPPPSPSAYATQLAPEEAQRKENEPAPSQELGNLPLRNKRSSRELRARRSFTFGVRSPDGGPTSPSATENRHKFFGNLLGKKGRKNRDSQGLSTGSKRDSSFEIIGGRAPQARSGSGASGSGASANGHAHGGLRAAPNGLPYAFGGKPRSVSSASIGSDSLLTSESQDHHYPSARSETPTSLSECGVGLDAAWADDEGVKTPRAPTRKESLIHFVNQQHVDGAVGAAGLRDDKGRGGLMRTASESDFARQRSHDRSPRGGKRETSRRATLGVADPTHEGAKEEIREDELRKTKSRDAVDGHSLSQGGSPRLFERRGVLGGRRAISIFGGKNPINTTDLHSDVHSPRDNGPSTPNSARLDALTSPSCPHKQTKFARVRPESVLSPLGATFGKTSANATPIDRSAGNNTPGGGGASGAAVEHIVAPHALIEHMRREKAEQDRLRRGVGGVGLSPPPPMLRTQSANSAISSRAQTKLGQNSPASLLATTPLSTPPSSSRAQSEEVGSAPMRKAHSAPVSRLSNVPRRGSFGLHSCGPLIEDLVLAEREEGEREEVESEEFEEVVEVGGARRWAEVGRRQLVC